MSETLNPTTIEKIAYDSENDATAAQALGVDLPTLRAALETRPELQAAWDRGHLLRKVRDLAGTALAVSQANKELGMAGQEFCNLLDADREVADVWNRERRQLRRRMAEAVVANAKQGDRSAARYCERFLRSEQTDPGQVFDFRRVPISVMTEITGKTRQTLNVWHRDNGCPRNPDCTYNLADFVRWWGRRAQIKRRRGDIVVQVREAIREELRTLVGDVPAAGKAITTFPRGNTHPTTMPEESFV